jgi:hypothetical protein
MKINTWLIAAAIFLSAQLGQAAQLELGQGTKSLGGTLSITVNPIAGVHQLLVAPSFSYFTADRIELALDAKFQTDLGSDSTGYLGGHFGVFGYLDMGPLFLKLGASLGLTTYLGHGDSVTMFEFVVPLLLVVPLSDAVALNCGTSVQIQIRPGGGANILIPIGLLGFQAFF